MQQQEIFFKEHIKAKFWDCDYFFFALAAVNIMFIMVVQKSHLHIHSGQKFEK